MPSIQTEYWLMVKPLHPIYGFPVPGKGRLSKKIDGIDSKEIETFYFRKYQVVCGTGCPFTIHAVQQPVWGLFEVCYSLEELRRAFKRAIKIYGASNVTILQHMNSELFITN